MNKLNKCSSQKFWSGFFLTERPFNYRKDSRSWFGSQKWVRNGRKAKQQTETARGQWILSF